MVKENSLIRMELFIKVNGKMIKKTVLENYLSAMIKTMREHFRKA